jgi:hypothetical protein
MRWDSKKIKWEEGDYVRDENKRRKYREYNMLYVWDSVKGERGKRWMDEEKDKRIIGWGERRRRTNGWGKRGREGGGEFIYEGKEEDEKEDEEEMEEEERDEKKEGMRRKGRRREWLMDEEWEEKEG